MNLHPLLAARWSPRGFDPDHVLDEQDLHAVLEAARWAPSAGNGQTTRWAVARRGAPEHEALLDLLRPGNRSWAPRASALLVAVATLSDGEREHPCARHDAGQAVAHLSVQAVAQGLHAHQMAGFDVPATAAWLGLPPEQVPVVVVALGVLGGPPLEAGLAERESRVRTRRPLPDLLLAVPGDPP